MKIDKLIIILALGFTLCACGRSKEAQFYMLNPIAPKTVSAHQYTYIKIGIESITTPTFTEKPQLMVYNDLNRVQLEEFHQWAESLDKNIKRVIKADLNTLLPGVVLEDAPWSIQFAPDYNLQINISEFKIDVNGNSTLLADYIVSHKGQIIKKYERFYRLKVQEVSAENLIKSMNTNLNHLSQDIANSFKAKYKSKNSRA